MPVANFELMIVAGEASGDELGADLVCNLKIVAPETKFFGTPGPKMRATGVESVFDSDDWSVVGVAAVARAVPKFLRLKKELRSLAAKRKPHAVVLIDFPEFNLKLAKDLKADGHRVIYYVSPQVWAWRQYRFKTIRDSVDLLLSILPFERSWYLEKGISNVEYVGNPVALRTRSLMPRSEFCSKHHLKENPEIVALLPGSRRREIDRHLDTMLEAAFVVRNARPDTQFVIAIAHERDRKVCEDKIESFNSRNSSNLATTIISNDTLNALNAADAAAISSGTATLEAGVIGTPMTVVYRIPKLDAAVFKRFVNVPHFALINLVAKKRIVHELIQNDFTSENLSAELLRLLEPATNKKVKKDLLDATKELRNGVTRDAAQVILEFLQGNLLNDLKS